MSLRNRIFFNLKIVLVIAFITFFQSNFFTWFNIFGIMPNLFLCLVIVLAVYLKRVDALIWSGIIGIWTALIYSTNVNNIVFFVILSFVVSKIKSSFSTEVKLNLLLIVFFSGFLYNTAYYIFKCLKNSLSLDLTMFAKTFMIEGFFNIMLVLLFYEFIYYKIYKKYLDLESY
jgi:cell shape-determining protein MreD